MLTLSIILFCYSMAIVVLIMGWRKVIRLDQSLKSSPYVSITVLVPFRNEGENVVETVLSLCRQQYMNFEIIAIDDHSSDHAREKLKHLGLANLKLVTNSGEGKKMAITTGVNLALGEIIVTTDADCLLPANWLMTLAEKFSDPGVEMVFGPVKLKQDGSVFSDMQAIEFSSLIASSAALNALGRPIMCNGASLAYRKKMFLEVGGYQGNTDIASGDDEFLMRKINKAKPGSIRYSGNDSVVTTGSKNSAKEFLLQRLRWAGKWKHNSSLVAIAVAILVVIIQIAWLLSLISLFVLPISTAFFLTVVIKVVVELLFLRMVCLGLKITWSSPAFLLLQVVYPVYVIIVGLGSNFVSYSWKGRKIQ